MQNRDSRKFYIGLNKDDNPEFIQQGEYVDALNLRSASSTEQNGAGNLETLQGEVMVDILGEATYYGDAIGGSFIYEGFAEVLIGSQVWMKKNWDVNYPGSKVYDDDETNRAIYGGLYTWEQIMQPDFCPSGWHVPTEAEVDALLSELGGALIAGAKMKEPDTDHWLTPNTGADDSSGFKGLGGGQFDAAFELLTEKGKFWMQDEYNPPTDGDGNVYMTVVIGTQEWAATNLKTTKYINGDPIDDIYGWVFGDKDGVAVPYENDPVYTPEFGLMYNWYAVNDPRGIAPAGYRIPTLADWQTLIAFLGGYGAPNGGKMKETGLAHWDSPNGQATDEYGAGLIGGGRGYNYGATFQELKQFGQYWANTEATPDPDPVNPGTAYWEEFNYTNGGITESTLFKDFVLSVRFMKDI